MTVPSDIPSVPVLCGCIFWSYSSEDPRRPNNPMLLLLSMAEEMADNAAAALLALFVFFLLFLVPRGVLEEDLVTVVFRARFFFF